METKKNPNIPTNVFSLRLLPSSSLFVFSLRLFRLTTTHVFSFLPFSFRLGFPFLSFFSLFSFFTNKNPTMETKKNRKSGRNDFSLRLLSSSSPFFLSSFLLSPFFLSPFFLSPFERVFPFFLSSPEISFLLPFSTRNPNFLPFQLKRAQTHY